MQFLFEENLISETVYLLLISIVDTEFVFFPDSCLHGCWHLAFLISG